MVEWMNELVQWMLSYMAHKALHSKAKSQYVSLRLGCEVDQEPKSTYTLTKLKNRFVTM